METMIRNTSVLYVDDEQNLLASFQSLLRKEDVRTVVLDDPLQVERVLLADGPFALVISDQRMPGRDGVAVLETVGRLHPETIRIMMTGYADYESTLGAINRGGITRFITKPWRDEELREIIRDAVIRYNLAAENRLLTSQLVERNAQLKAILDGTVTEMVRILGDLTGLVNPQAGAFNARIRSLGTAALALMTEVPQEERWEMERALDLFCLGLVVLPAWVQVSIAKHGLGSLDRFPAAKNHHLLAAGLLKDIPQFAGVARIIRFLERDFDGSGEPQTEHARGDAIPLGSRLLHILLDAERQSTANFRGREVLERMMHRPEKYDTKLIARMLSVPPVRLNGRTPVQVPVDRLLPGMVLLDDLVTTGGHCLLRPQVTLTGTAIHILQQWHAKDPFSGPIRVLLPE